MMELVSKRIWTQEGRGPFKIHDIGEYRQGPLILSFAFQLE
jgi:hypothetical protein